MIERADPREFFGFLGRAGVAGEGLAEQAEIVVGEQRAGPGADVLGQLGRVQDLRRAAQTESVLADPSNETPLG